MSNAVQPLDFFALGEVLVDLISTEVVPDLGHAGSFQRFAGGQPANLAANMARLGLRSALGGCVGRDGLGKFIRRELAHAGVLTDYIQQTDAAPTTVIAVGRSTATPEFIIYRGADAHLEAAPALLAQAAATRIIHTSAHALARNPARQTILQALETARAAGALVTFDPNYHPKVWPDTPDYRKQVIAALAHVDVVKPSIEDCARLLGPGAPPAEYAAWFIEAGARFVVLTLGAEGAYVLPKEGAPFEIVSAPPSVVDVTGAGDSFWSGFLAAYLQGQPLAEAAWFGQAVAERKIGVVGPLTQMPAWADLVAAVAAIQQRR